MNSPARNRKPLTGLGRDRKDVVSENGRQNRGFPIPLALFLGSFRPSPDRGFLFRAGEFIPRRSGTTGVGIHSPALWHDGRGNSFPGALARRAWEFIPRRSGTTGVGIHSPALWHDGDSDFAIALRRRIVRRAVSSPCLKDRGFHGPRLIIWPGTRTVDIWMPEGMTSLPDQDTLNGGEILPDFAMIVAEIFPA